MIAANIHVHLFEEPESTIRFTAIGEPYTLQLTSGPNYGYLFVSLDRGQVAALRDACDQALAAKMAVTE